MSKQKTDNCITQRLQIDTSGNCSIMDTEEIINSAQEKTEKICSAIKNNNLYNGFNEDIDFIYECVFNKRKSIWEYCIGSLWEISLISKDVREKIIDIMEKGNAHEKFIITCSVSRGYAYGLNTDFIKQILKYAISDKNKKVKIFGAQRADSLNLYDFAEIIKNEIEKTNDNEIIKNLTDNYIFLTKGYIIEGTWLTIKNSFATRLPEGLDEEKIHSYIIEKYKDKERIKDLYYKNNKENIK